MPRILNRSSSASSSSPPLYFKSEKSKKSIFTTSSSSLSSTLLTSSTSSSSSSASSSSSSSSVISGKNKLALTLLLSISIIFFVIGITGIFFSLFTILRPNQTPFSVSRCSGRRVQDTFRNFYPTITEDKNRKLGDRVDDGGIIQRPKLLGFVGVQTGFGSIDRRASLRSTWFPSNHDSLIWLEQATGIAFRFVIGRSKNAKKMSELEKEVEKYNDFLLIDVEEEYLRLPYKTLAFFKAAFDLFEADYYVKADDTVYLRPDRLATLLAKERPHPMTYIGCMKKGPVITDPKMKWYEKSGHLIGNEYFTHAYGPLYALSAEVVASLAAARNDSLRMFNNEDVTIGSWMLSMNVHHEDNRAICDPRCTPTSIAVWDIPKCSGLCNPSKKLKELHKMSMCSKSPTLPPEDR